MNRAHHEFVRNLEAATSRELRIVDDRVKGSVSVATTDVLCMRQRRRRVVACFSILATLLFAAATQRQASAISISIVYSTDFGGDESPSWDPNGTILKAHFSAARDIWESLITSSGSYEFDFQWDDDISGLGLTTDIPAIDTFIEINPNRNWWIDTTPHDNDEFDLSTAQTLYNQLSSGNQSTYFPGTAPPGTLEVGFRGTGQSGFANAPGQPNFDADTGNDLLSTIVHEIGHVLGIGADALGEPGEFNIFPHHVGGLTNVLVLEDDDSGHLGGDGIVPFLMCQGCGAAGVRRFPTATDVLVIAEDQGLNSVRLERVGSISSGLWSDTNRWIGGAVPNRDVYISHGGTVTMDINGNTRDLLVSPANTVDLQNNQLNVEGTLTMSGGTVNVDSGGTLAANNLVRGNGTLTTAAGSTVRFNSFTSSPSSPVNFNGSVGIGYDVGPGILFFNPTSNSVWTIAEQLSIGDENSYTAMLIYNSASFTSATGRIGTDFNGGGEGIVEISDPGSSWTINGALDARNGALGVYNQGQLQTGSVSLGDDEGVMIATVDGSSSTWTVNGNVDIGPPTLTGSGQGGLTVQNNGLMTVSVNLDVHGTLNVTSYVVVDTNGTLDVAGDITIGPFGEVQLLGSTLRAGKLLPFFGGTFTWTNGTLDLTDQAVILDSALPALPLAASTTLLNNQTLILNGVGRDLIVGRSATGQLDLLNTASVQVNNGDVLIAENAGSVGTVQLLGANTSFFVDGSMAVGGNQAGPGGSGQLTVAGDLTVTETLTYWATASVFVDSTGTLSADILRRGGGGGLGVNTNGHVRFNMLEGFGPNITIGGISAIGIAEGNTGQGALVRNTNEDYSFREGWIIGDNAPAQVNLINGGDASGDGFVHMGNRPGSGGTVLNVSGVNGFGFPSQLNVSNTDPDSLIVGVKDVATMNVTSQGRVNSGGATIARDLTASGSQAVVDGQNSNWEVHGDLVVGGNAQGQLTIKNQGLVEIDSTLWIGGAPTEDPPGGKNGGPTTPSVVLITGDNSHGVAHLDTVVGFDLSGTLLVEQQGQMTTDQSAYIAYNPLSAGSSALVSNLATWGIGQDQFVGYQNMGTLTIQTQGQVVVGTNFNPTSGNVHIATLLQSGGSAATVTGGGQWIIPKQLVVGNQAQGALFVDTLSQVLVGGMATIARQSSAGNSSVQVSSRGMWQIGADLIVGDQTQGTLVVDTEGLVTVGAGATIAKQIADEFSSVTVSTFGVWDIGADLRVGDLTQGSLQVDSNGQVFVGGDAYLGAGGPSGVGLVTLNGIDDTVVTLQVQGGLFVGGDSLASIGQGQLGMEGSTLLQANHVVNWNQGEFHLAGRLDVGLNPVENHGLFSGSGMITGELRNRGEVSPGAGSTGSIVVNSIFSQFTTGTLTMDLAATDFDQLVIPGTTFIQGGALNVGLLDGFMPILGDQFQIFSYGGAVFGPGFSTLDLPALSPGLKWETGNLLSTGILEVVAVLPGDFDGDGDGDGFDFLQWQRDPSVGSLADWQSSYGMVAPLSAASAAVPEPNSLALLSLSGLLVALRRFRRATACTARP